MAELRPTPFRDLVTRLHREPLVRDAVFGLHRRYWRRTDPNDPDTGVFFHGERVGAPCGPAAGPHTQMAQNILLSYVAGGRVIELKTVHERGTSRVPRTGVDILNSDVHVDWSLQLPVADALQEYVAGAMLIEMYRRNEKLFDGMNAGLSGAVAYDVGVGYDLAGVSSRGVREFLDTLRSAGMLVERLRAEIPGEFAATRGLAYPARIINSVTLSVCSDCSASEIEKIGEMLVGEHGLDLTVKMNPALLGRRKLEYLLRDVLGYDELHVDERACNAGMTARDAVDLCRRLADFAARRTRYFRVKIGEPLEVVSSRIEGEVAYLAGPPLHVLATTVAEELCRELDPLQPISFSGGIDGENFPLAVACGFAPSTAGTDLLRSGYDRLGAHMDALIQSMRQHDALSINEYILKRFDVEAAARRWAEQKLGADAKVEELEHAAVAWAGRHNTAIVAKTARDDSRYHAEQRRHASPGVDGADSTDSPICPNAAIFPIAAPLVSFDYNDVRVSAEGVRPCKDEQVFTIERSRQLACYADCCGECGLCATRCGEAGALLDEPPRFHRSFESWRQTAPRDGYVVHEQPEGGWIRARLAGKEYQLTYVRQTQQYVFDDGMVEAVLSGWGHGVVSARLLQPLAGAHRLNMRIYHLLRYLREGIVDERNVNPINVQWMACRRAASGSARK